jgi:hypothetical protein
LRALEQRHDFSFTHILTLCPAPGSSLERIPARRSGGTTRATYEPVRVTRSELVLPARTRREDEGLKKLDFGDNSEPALNPIGEWPAVPGDSVPTHVNWCAWAKRIQEETDPQKVFALVRQLLAELDDKTLRESLPPEAG